MYYLYNDMVLVKKLMGHSSIKTTDKYIKADERSFKGIKTPMEAIKLKKDLKTSNNETK